jgi:SPP1 gp7 family putative phage head morphogenesis protein
MPEPVDLGYAFTLAPAKAVEYFRNKGHRISWNWYDTYQEANAKAFTVAKVARLDVLQDIRGAVDGAIANGTIFADFKKDLEPTLRNKGWWGKQIVVDSQGVAEQVQLGSVRRLKTIYGTNLQTSYMAGRWKGMDENASERPYWQYIAIDDAATRDKHRAMHKRVFRWDDPIWQSMYPPNDWGCRCRVRALTEKQVKQKGLSVEASDGKLRESMELVSKRTGEVQPVTGYDLGGGETFKPGAGWSYNPGAAHWQPDLDNYPYATAKQYIEGAVSGPPFEDFYRRIDKAVTQTTTQRPGLSNAVLLDEVKPLLSKEWMPVASLAPNLQAVMAVQTNQVLLSQDTLAKQLINRAGQPVSLASYRQIQSAINNATDIIQTARNLTFYHTEGNQLFRLVLKRTQPGELFVVSYHPVRDGTRKADIKKGEVLRGGN